MTPERVLVEERIHPLTQKRTLTTRFGDVGDGASGTPMGQYPDPPPDVILFNTRFFQAAATATKDGRVALVNGTENQINDESMVLTITATNTTADYDIHPAYWPGAPADDFDWYIGTIR